MFINREVFDTLNAARLKAEGAVGAQATQIAQLVTHIEWMQTRVTQLEFERAQLIKRYMNVDLPVPQFEAAPPQHPDLNQTMSFNDVGDRAAAEMGLAWRDDGTVQYDPAN